jgi:hypothetical protein
LLLADAHLAVDARESAEDALREAIEVSRTLEAEGFLPNLLLRLACILDAAERRAERLDLLRAALAAAQAQGADAVAMEAEGRLKLMGRQC